MTHLSGAGTRDISLESLSCMGLSMKHSQLMVARRILLLIFAFYHQAYNNYCRAESYLGFARLVFNGNLIPGRKDELGIFMF